MIPQKVYAWIIPDNPNGDKPLRFSSIEKFLELGGELEHNEHLEVRYIQPYTRNIDFIPDNY